MIDGLKQIELKLVARSAGVELKQAGNRYVGLCPLHQEKTPSFFVFPNNRWKCFGCHEAGDAIDFVRRLHGLSFPDALKHLGLDQQGPMTPEVKRQIQARRHRSDLIKRFRRWEMRKADQTATMIRCIHKVAATWKTPDDLERAGDILDMLPKYEHELDVLCSRDDRLKFELYFKGATNDKYIQPG